VDIKDLYVKIPNNCILSVTENNCIDEYIIREIISVLKMIMNQNYFQYDSKCYKPESSVTMGSPLSNTMAEIFLQDLEQNRIKHFLEDEKIIYYNSYIDDIFMIYNQRKLTSQSLFKQFNA
jgi:hypothetical protein